MKEKPTNVCIATLGSHPQIITSTLDALLAQDVPIREVIVVHLAPQNPQYRAALDCLSHTFADDCYAGHACRYRRLPVQLGPQVITDLNDEAAIDATLNTFHRLIQHLKQQAMIVHLCLSGGQRLLSMLALSAALLHFDQTDRIWHLATSDAIDQPTDYATFHGPGHSPTRLLRIAVPAWGHFFPALRMAAENGARTMLDVQTRRLDAGEHARCQQVYERLTTRPREVLQALAAGLTLQEVAERLGITIGTVHAHKTTIFEECRIVWGLSPAERLSFLWLRDKFTPYFAV